MLDGDLGCLTELFDNQEPSVSLDHALDVHVLVPRTHEKAPGVAADRFVAAVSDLQRLGAVFLAALADEPDQEGVSLAVANHEAGGHLLHALVHLAEEGFVLRPALFLRIHPGDSLRSGFSLTVVGQSLSVGRSANKRAENEAAFRDANEDLKAKAAELGVGDERTPYLCECEDETCVDILRLTRSEYEEVRADPRRFVVRTGHHQLPYDKVIREASDFTIIEKTGEEGELVAQRDPRSAG